MGWCSVTTVFDAVAKFVLDPNMPEVITDEMKYEALNTLATMLEENDWDCQSDSDYYNHPIVQRIMHEHHPRWFEKE